MKRSCLFLLFFLIWASGIVAQSPGVSRTGSVKCEGAAFVNRYGERVMYPSLNQNGQILRYAPLVSMDSVQLSDTVVTTACLYGKVVFDGWSPVLSCGFDYATSRDFSGCHRVECVADVGEKTAVISELAYNQQYYVRAFAINQYGTSYADTLPFRTTVGPVTIESVQAEIQTPYSFDVAVLLGERGGLPVSGEIAVFADEDHQTLAFEKPVGPMNSNYAISSFSGLDPATTYYVRVALTNGPYSDTVFLQVRTPSDLVLSIESDKALSVSLCTGGTRVAYRAVLTGSDRNKPYYDLQWTTLTGYEIVHDTVVTVLYETAGTFEVSVRAIYGGDTISASIEQVITPRSGTASFYVCTNEFLNTADVTTTGIASIRWLNENNDIVATANSVKLPTGYYTVECVDGYGCILSKEVYVGKKKLSCAVQDTPSSHESARFEDGVWKIDSISDVDGYWYAVTQIGERCWLRQNLRTRHMPSTHADLLGTGSNYTPNMHYKDVKYVYDPESTPYYGSFYNWCAAMDVSYADYNRVYNFSSQRQGICPDGWHIPNKEEIWEMLDTMLDFCCRGMDYMPAPRAALVNVAQNTPIKYMMLRCCYDSYTNPAYSEEIYDASNLSLPSDLGTSMKFWLVDFADAEYMGYCFWVKNTAEGVSVFNAARNGNFMPVRCVRNYPEE